MNVRQRQPREHDEAFLAYLRTLPCTICGILGCDPAHIRSASRRHGKRPTGMAEKPDDRWCLPLCRPHHDEQHRHNEVEWWASYGIDPFDRAQELYASRPGADKPRPERKPRERKTPPRKPRSERTRVLQRPASWPKRTIQSKPFQQKGER